MSFFAVRDCIGWNPAWRAVQSIRVRECKKRRIFLLRQTRLKCKSSARVKIVLKKDWIVKKVFKSWKMLKKMFKKIENV